MDAEASQVGFARRTYVSASRSCSARLRRTLALRSTRWRWRRTRGTLFLDFPPRYSIAKVVGILKSISASQVFAEFPEVKKQLWAGELWEDGYFARTVGDKVTAEVIRRYIRHHKQTQGQQLKLF